ncbi:MAG: hypothetical protein EOM24_27975, partial [Chloroflexia bacterium]|nr:hypothetical protein [Chloroflexia bacterium]
MMHESPPTAASWLQVGHYFLREEQLYQITIWDPFLPLVVEARRLADDVSMHFSLTDLFAPMPLTRFGATPAALLAPPPAPPKGVSGVVVPPLPGCSGHSADPYT